MNCPKCSTTNSENAKFCKSCGFDIRGNLKLAPVEQPVGLSCSKCSAENSAQAKFCKVCGTSTANAQAVPALPNDLAPPHVPVASLVAEPPHVPTPPLIPVTPLVPVPLLVPEPQPASPPVLAPPPTPVPPLVQVQPPALFSAPVPAPPPAPSPPPIPALPLEPAPPSIPEIEVMNGVACYKCKTINNPTAKFCKSCGTPNPGTTPASPPNPLGPGDPEKPWVLWASIAAGVSAVAIGGASWMFAGGTKPKTTSFPAAPLPQTAASASAPAALPTPTAAVLPNSPAPETAASAVASGTPALPAPAPPLPAAPAQKEAVADKPPPAATKMLPDELKEGPTPVQRDAREAARKRQAELDQIARQKERDKASMNKANRTLDDLLK